MQRIFLLALGVGVVASLFTAAVAISSVDEPPPSVQTSAEDPQGTAAPRALSKEPRWSGPGPAAARTRPHRLPAEAEERQAGEDPALSPSPASDERLIDEHERDLLARLDEEARDASWSGVTEAAVREAFASEAFAGAQLASAECRSTLCRVEMTLDDELSRDGVLEALPMTAPFATNGLIRQRPDEDRSVVVFFTREGEQL